MLGKRLKMNIDEENVNDDGNINKDRNDKISCHVHHDTK